MGKRASWLLIFCSIYLLHGCYLSPSQDLLGSYFPSWMLCAVISLIFTVIVYSVLVKTGIDDFVPAKLLTYLGLTIALTFIIWLIWFGN